MKLKRAGSQPSQVALAEYFTGTVRIDPFNTPSAPAKQLCAAVMSTDKLVALGTEIVEVSPDLRPKSSLKYGRDRLKAGIAHARPRLNTAAPIDPNRG